MPDLVHRQFSDGIAILEISNPPANVISADLRAELSTALSAALSDPDIATILLIAAGRDFCTGFDFSETRSPKSRKASDAAPSLLALCAQIETSPKPVVAAIQGMAFSGGAEIVLASHYRLAQAGAQIAFPDVQMGLLPHAGTTQRLPRLLGAGPALDLLLGGRPVHVARPPVRALFDAVVAEDLRGATHRFCAALKDAGSGPRPSNAAMAGLRDPMAFQAAIAERRQRLENHPERARHAILDCVEAAQLLPFEAGLAREEAAYFELAGSEQSQALRHIFLAERRLLSGAAQEAARLRPDARIAVLGGGPLATQVVIRALEHGLTVQWGTRDPTKLRAGMAEVTEVLTAKKARGAVTDKALRNLLDRLTLGESHKMAENVSAAIIAARGQGAVPLPEGAPRLKLFPDPVTHVDLRLATPIGTSNFAEVLIGSEASEDEVRTARALVRRLGKLPLAVVTRGPGVTERMMSTLHAAADALIDMGEDPYSIDLAVRRMGWPRPPFETRDLRGLADFANEKRVEGARNWSAVVAQTGRQGLEAGRGFYLHQQSGMRPDPSVLKLLDDMRPPARSPRSVEEITELLLAVLANEGAAMLQRRSVARPYEIDIAMHLGEAFPRWLGGPMMAADRAGLFHVKRILEGVDHPDTRLWHPHPVWAELVKNGKRFGDLNG
ncbi:Fatty acid oxidation complex subunit alpha [Roseivivax sp. THAF40]|uniref:enoyl-CoA hydratase-related protein n=1 Tax=Roseivivax sp. THAF40 TaxID=2587858 RepID=UPI001269587B|nr:enoyl-CoA hydratase-related protein [Roseivivax sp. THAF40]QFT47629.1 Fatty acid oxidation complex subunit alpha [Roseivivax sp. THAF40]